MWLFACTTVHETHFEYTYRSNCSSTADSSSNRWTFRGSIDCWVKLSSAL